MGRNYKDLGNLDRIELEIPHIRCTARSLCGDRYAADRLAAECISVAVADRDLLTPNLSARAWLLRILWRVHGAGRDGRIAPAEDPHRESTTDLGDEPEFVDMFSCFRSLDDDARFTLVLVSVNNLSHEEAAYVFDNTAVEFQSRLAEARFRLSALVAGKNLPSKKQSI